MESVTVNVFACEVIENRPLEGTYVWSAGGAFAAKAAVLGACYKGLTSVMPCSALSRASRLCNRRCSEDEKRLECFPLQESASILIIAPNVIFHMSLLAGHSAHGQLPKKG